MRVNGEVGGDALAVCGACRFGEASKVGVDALISGGELDLSGAVARGLRGAGEKVRLRSFVLGLAVLSLLRLIPVLGALVNLTATLAGLGGLCLLLVESRGISVRLRLGPTVNTKERSSDGT